MFSLKDFIFGKKKFIKTDHLGVFDARVRKDHSLKEKTWASTIKSPNYPTEIVILLDGNSSGPHSRQINSVSQIIKNLPKINEALFLKFSSDPKLREQHPSIDLSRFRLCCISPWDNDKNSFELEYEFMSEDKKELSVILENGLIKEILW